jgi:hypothetical protein
VIGVLVVATRRQWIAFLLAILLALLIQRHVGADERVTDGLVVPVDARLEPEATTSLVFLPTCDEGAWREMCGEWWDWCRFFGAYCPSS